MRLQVVIVTPANADANNGNWRTARRWARFLAGDYRVRLAQEWSDGDEALMIALHARRSAASIAAWRARHPRRPLVLVLTGTDLYRDIAVDGSAQHSLALADRLVVLNERGPAALPAQFRSKAVVILQSSPGRSRAAKTRRLLRVVMVGHLRDEKCPETFFDVARRLAGRPDIVFEHVGDALDPTLAAEARALVAQDPRYRWFGPLSHRQTLARIRAAHVLVHPSCIEGGAHVVIEAVRNGTAVLASRIDGNVGLLGEDYGGYFPVGDSAALAALLQRMRDDPQALQTLQAQCDARAALFDPGRESAALRSMVSSLLR
ncbi:MAG: selenoneine biosynthesis selenosugar synthase SenB [Burkholderiaceae bacterium]|jgi:putative glycosyltransferase (TIGR04348 family)|nr:selenoneine biosynthesis selenosugar synthase SenB [Burkholderiaceae bacterium]